MKRALLGFLAALFVCVCALAESAEQPLVVEDMVCRGNASTSCTFILGQVYLAQGDIVNEEELENAKLRLMFLRNFATVSIYLEKGSARGKARVVVEVSEANPITTELAYSLYKRGEGYGQALNGRITHYNLFGTGKILDARASIVTPFGEPDVEQYFVRAQYIDPHLFDSKRNFFSVGASFLDSHLSRGNGDLSDDERVSYDVTFGRRLWDFSYVTIGYQYRPVANVKQHIRSSDGQFVDFRGVRANVLVYGFGWNSEDDAYFPTRGSRLEAVLISDGRSDEYSSLFYRRTWQWGENIWSAQFQDPRTFSFELARPYIPKLAEGDITRGRWIVGAGFEPSGYNFGGGRIYTVGVNAGLRFESKRFGIVQLSASYNEDVIK